MTFHLDNRICSYHRFFFSFPSLNIHRDLHILLSKQNVIMPLDQVNMDDEIPDHAHESIYLQPIYFQSIQDKLTDKLHKDINKENKSLPA